MEASQVLQFPETVQNTSAKDISHLQMRIFGSFHLGKTELGVEVQKIQEVVNMPLVISPMPLAPEYLIGIFNLRGSIIPIIDLKQLLDISDSDAPRSSRKVAIIEHEGAKLGLLFDSTGEVIRISHADVNFFHYSELSRRPIIQGALKLDHGKRIVQLLDVKELIQIENVPFMEQNTELELLQKRRMFNRLRRQCISFQVNGMRLGFSIDCIHEIIKVPQIQKSALMGDLCLGMITLRGTIVPIVSFSRLLESARDTNRADNADTRIIIINIHDEKFGLYVDSVESIVTFYEDEILHLPVINKVRAKLFVGCIPRESTGDIILLDNMNIFSNEEIHEITKGHSQLYKSSEAQLKEKKVGKRKTYIIFKLDSHVGVPIEEIREILDQNIQILKPPGLPSTVEGVLNLRGELVTIVDARRLYDLHEKTKTPETKILIFDQLGIKYGLLVDSIENILTFDEKDKIPLPDHLFDKSSRIMQNDMHEIVEVTIQNESKNLMILDTSALLNRIQEITN